MKNYGRVSNIEVCLIDNDITLISNSNRMILKTRGEIRALGAVLTSLANMDWEALENPDFKTILENPDFKTIYPAWIPFD